MRSREQNRHSRGNWRNSLRHFYFSELIIQLHDLLRRSHVPFFFFGCAVRNLSAFRRSLLTNTCKKKNPPQTSTHFFFLMRILEILFVSGVSIQRGFFCIWEVRINPTNIQPLVLQISRKRESGTDGQPENAQWRRR